jgi:hypothetical protein
MVDGDVETVTRAGGEKPVNTIVFLEKFLERRALQTSRCACARASLA